MLAWYGTSPSVRSCSRHPCLRWGRCRGSCSPTRQPRHSVYITFPPHALMVTMKVAMPIMSVPKALRMTAERAWDKNCATRLQRLKLV